MSHRRRKYESAPPLADSELPVGARTVKIAIFAMVKGRRCVLVLEKHEPEGDDLPGGRCEPTPTGGFEPDPVALKREVREETGGILDWSRVVKVHEDRRVDRSGKDPYVKTYGLYATDSITFPAGEPDFDRDEHRGLRWVPYDEQFASRLDRMSDRYVETIRRGPEEIRRLGEAALRLADSVPE